MAGNYERFLHVLSKWPAEVSQTTWDYGHHLRQIIKNKDAHGNVFSGGTVENTKIMDSLLRLINNTYIKKYPCKVTKGASLADSKFIEEVLHSSFVKRKQ